MSVKSLLLSLPLLVCALPFEASAQTCPCYGAFTCQGNCAGSACCSFGCTDYATDPFNCGGCGASCGTNSTCVAGACQCVTGATRPCYSGPFGTANVGTCRKGTQSCSANAWGACTGEVVPTAESCNGLDDDCDGRADNTPQSSSPLSQDCYSGPAGTRDAGACRGGRSLCTAADGGTMPDGGANPPSWGPCLGEVVPSSTVTCGDGGFTASDAGVVCGGSCYDGPAGTAGIGVCRPGVLSCEADGGTTCTGQVLPAAPRCGGQDYDCNGTVDQVCGPEDLCRNGICVPGYCTGEFSRPCPTGYLCAPSGGCEAEPCADGGVCPPATVCVLGGCRVPCNGACTSAQTCFNDRCVANDCTSFGCPAGSVCETGQCRADACAAVTCGAGEQCRFGQCTRSCAGVSCPAGEKCVAGGVCQADACATVTCAVGQVCESGACVADPCTAVTCPVASVCRGGSCVENPCAGVRCPDGAACYPDGVCATPTTSGGTGGGAGGAGAGGGGGDNGAGGGDGAATAKGCGCGATGAELMLFVLASGLLYRKRKATR